MLFLSLALISYFHYILGRIFKTIRFNYNNFSAKVEHKVSRNLHVKRGRLQQLALIWLLQYAVAKSFCTYILLLLTLLLATSVAKCYAKTVKKQQREEEEEDPTIKTGLNKAVQYQRCYLNNNYDNNNINVRVDCNSVTLAGCRGNDAISRPPTEFRETIISFCSFLLNNKKRQELSAWKINWNNFYNGTRYWADDGKQL